jgi:hypothetical protein
LGNAKCKFGERRLVSDIVAFKSVHPLDESGDKQGELQRSGDCMRRRWLVLRSGQRELNADETILRVVLVDYCAFILHNNEFVSLPINLDWPI